MAMRATEAANRPRWQGEAGFFEIWFLVVLEPEAGRACWLRWTTFAPMSGAPRATLWAASFDAAAAEPAVALKSIQPAAAFSRGPADTFAVGIGESELRDDGCHGVVQAGSRSIAWELTWTPGTG